jgi:hypothetical protein
LFDSTLLSFTVAQMVLAFRLGRGTDRKYAGTEEALFSSIKGGRRHERKLGRHSESRPATAQKKELGDEAGATVSKTSRNGVSAGNGGWQECLADEVTFWKSLLLSRPGVALQSSPTSACSFIPDLLARPLLTNFACWDAETMR